MKAWKIASLSLVLGGTFLLTGCRPRTEEVREIIEVPEMVAPVEVPEMVAPVEVPEMAAPVEVSEVAAPVEVPEVAAPETIHTVVKGETLWSIAEQRYGDPTKWRLIYEANKDTMDNPDDLKLGQKLIIPRQPDGNLILK